MNKQGTIRKLDGGDSVKLFRNNIFTRWDYLAYVSMQKPFVSVLYICGILLFFVTLLDVFFTQIIPTIGFVFSLLGIIVTALKLIYDWWGFKKYGSYMTGQFDGFSLDTIHMCESDILNDAEKIGSYARIAVTPIENDLKSDYIFMSHQLNKYLWDLTHTLRQVHDKNKEKRLKALIKDHWEDLSHYLKYKTVDSVKTRRAFYNETKLCMGSGFEMTDDKTILIANYSKGTYFDTYLTNIIYGKNLVCGFGDNSFREATDAFLAMKPYSNKQNQSNTRIEAADTLKSFRHSILNNDWGVSTIAITKDHHVFQLIQSTRADSSPMLIVPSGSGSCDYDDLHGDDFRKTMTYAMQRELWEEAGFTCRKKEKRQQVNDFGKTRIIGFFRWLEKNGKPEMLGVSYIDKYMHELNPDIAEVQKKPVLQRTIHTMCEFKEYLKDVKTKTRPPSRASYKGVSVPLLASVIALEELLKDNNIAKEMAEFLNLVN